MLTTGAGALIIGGTLSAAEAGKVRPALVTQVDRPLFLAGGLRASNVRAAVRAGQPFGLDLCSSVRHEGKLSPEKLCESMQAVRAAA